MFRLGAAGRFGSLSLLLMLATQSFGQEPIFFEGFSTDGDGVRYEMFGRGSDTSPDAWDHTFSLAQSNTFPLGPGGDITIAANRVAIPWNSNVDNATADAIPFFDSAVAWASDNGTGLNVSFLVGDNPTQGGLAPGDAAAFNRLGDLGHTVNLFDTSSINNDVLGSTDLLLVSDSANAANIYRSINIRNVEVPVVNYSNGLADDLLLTTSGGSLQQLSSLNVTMPGSNVLPPGLTQDQTVGITAEKTSLPEYGPARTGVNVMATYRGPFARSIQGLETVDAMVSGTAGSLTGVETYPEADLNDNSSGSWDINNPIPLPEAPSFNQTPGSMDQYAVVSRGTLVVEDAGQYVLGLGGDDGGRLRLNGEDVIVDDSFHGFQYRTTTVDLPAGEHEIEWTGFEGGGGSGFELSYVNAVDSSGNFAADIQNFGDVISTSSFGIALKDPGLEVTSYFLAPELGPDVATDNPAVLAAPAQTQFRLPSEPFENPSGDYLLGTDMDSIPNSDAPPGVITFNPINLSGVADPKLTMNVAATFGLDDEADFLEGVYVTVESGGTFEEYELIANDMGILHNPETGQVFDSSFTSVTFDLPSGLGETTISIEVGTDSSGESIGIDDICISDGDPTAVCPIKIRQTPENRIQHGAASRINGVEASEPYLGLEDTEVRFSDPDGDLSEKLFLNPDGSDGGGEVHGLTRFNDLIGDGENQIPADADIESATLNINITGPGTPLSLHRMLQPWEDDTATWNAFAGGIQADDVEAKAEADDVQTADTGITTWDITETLKAWQEDPESNFGWVMLPQGTNGVDYLSAEAIDLDTSGLQVAPYIDFVFGTGGVCDPNTMGDLDGNGMVDFADFLTLSGNFGMSVEDHTQGDIDCNGTVEFADFLTLSGSFGQSVGAESVPEPAALPMAMLAIVVAGAMRRRRS